MRYKICFSKFRPLGFLFITASLLRAQDSPDTLARILDRLNALERQNQALLNEIQALRKEVQAVRASPSTQNQTAQERLDVAEQRIKEQAQTKVESSQRFPIKLTGMLLFDAYRTTGAAGYESTGYTGDGGPGGATFSQSILGFEFHGPSLPEGGQVRGFLSMDFYDQLRGYSVLRFREGAISFDWKRRSIIFAQEKPLVSPLQPTSFARVGVPPLAGAGNLWLWRPQVRYEERLPLGRSTEMSFQVAALQTNETYSAPALPAYAGLEASRPAIEGRIGVGHSWQEQKRLSAGIGFHASSTHILGTSVPSRLISADILFKPLSKLELTGTIFHGENFANLGGAPPGFTITSMGTVIPVHGSGGWVQVAVPVTRRLTFDLYAGRQLNNPHDLSNYEIESTLTYASNVLYRIAPNVVLGLEASQTRLTYLYEHPSLSNRYDATVAYLF